jgi:hypothetical protein
MIQRRKRMRLAREPREALRIVRQLLGKNLEGNLAVQLRVAGAIHLAHASRTDEGNDFVGAEPGARLEGHVLADYTRGDTQALLSSAVCARKSNNEC